MNKKFFVKTKTEEAWVESHDEELWKIGYIVRDDYLPHVSGEIFMNKEEMAQLAYILMETLEEQVEE